MSSGKFSVGDVVKSVEKAADHVKGDDSPELYAALAYVPFIGWILPFAFRKHQKLCDFHATQAFKLNLGIAAIMCTVWILKYFPIISWVLSAIKFNPIVTDFLNYLAWIVLISFSSLGAIKAYKKEMYELPLIAEIEEKIKEISSASKNKKSDK
ncbi:MAG: DUF4870 domain-containing protein [Leptospiraceae bacterium]|nr:DUF4870 domain-containing protein [Leptospiraceae bacterium]